MKAVQFGAGNIGRGFLGQLFYETGYSTIFVEVAPSIVDGLQQRHEYPLRIVGDENVNLTIRNVDAIPATDVDAVARAVAEADVAATAVGVNVLPRVAPSIARGLALRFESAGARPLNIIICENLIDAAPFLREHVRGHLEPRFHEALDTQVGFVEASIGRMVPIMTPEVRAEDPLLVCVEAYCELPVDAQGFRGPVPPLAHMQPRMNFKGYVERKLFVHNAAHAGAAYLGYLRRHEFIWQAIQDPKVRAATDAAMEETCAGLVAKHGFTPQELKDHWADLTRRFQNKALGDQVARVAGDPIRKLGPHDRLTGAALMCLEHNIEPRNVALVAAAAMYFDPPGDPAAAKLQEIRRSRGVDGVIAEVCRLPEDSPLTALFRQGAQRLRDEGWLT